MPEVNDYYFKLNKDIYIIKYVKMLNQKAKL